MFKRVIGRISLMAALLLPMSAMAQQLTLVDFNIRSFEKSNGAGQTLVDDIYEYVDFLKSADADVITLNEFETGTSRMGKEKMAELASRLGMYYAYFIMSYPKDGIGYYGNVILSRYPMLNCASARLSYQNYKGEGNYDQNSTEYSELWGADQRSVGYADILVPVSATENRIVRVCCSHLDHKVGDAGRKRQFEEVVKFAALGNPPYPALLAGDMNTWTSDSAMEPVLSVSDHLYDNWVDHIFAFPKGTWTKVSQEVIYSNGLSDHNAIKVVVKL
ncbi:MAG: endonuclease/exonuclease/phosphatase family protein [Clostridium sp.]|nr:endonuclease/exonuclease/phosphatase family protein [Bacteroides sp.]MCM1199177.1 endonuclease/exonuclease/phosphatase family protein [Clostridium sp.]